MQKLASIQNKKTSATVKAVDKKAADKKAAKKPRRQSLPVTSAPFIVEEKDSIRTEVDLTKEVEQKLSLDDWAKNLKLIWTSEKEY